MKMRRLLLLASAFFLTACGNSSPSENPPSSSAAPGASSSAPASSTGNTSSSSAPASSTGNTSSSSAPASSTGNTSSQSSEPAHTHTFASTWEHDEENHWHPATCGHNDQVSDLAAHVWGEGVLTQEPTVDAGGTLTYTCSVCQATKTESTDPLAPSSGLSFKLNEDGQSYTLKGIGSCADVKLIIPSTYNDLPVVKIDQKAFYENETIQSVSIPDSVIDIWGKPSSGVLLSPR